MLYCRSTWVICLTWKASSTSFTMTTAILENMLRMKKEQQKTRCRRSWAKERGCTSTSSISRIISEKNVFKNVILTAGIQQWSCGSCAGCTSRGRPLYEQEVRMASRREREERRKSHNRDSEQRQDQQSSSAHPSQTLRNGKCLKQKI